MAPATDLVSLPTGGGAQAGLGESFSPDLFTGTGNFTVPISLPAGRNKFNPSLTLTYSSGFGNGPFGLGWNLGLPRVVRKVSAGVPSYDDAGDTFILSGLADDLVQVEGDLPGVVRYQPRIEGGFARIEFHRDDADSVWTVRTRDGLVSRYGGVGPANTLTRDPHAASPVAGIFAWHLRETVDPFGNRIVYDYDVEPSTDEGHDGTQTYLRSIRYVEMPGAVPERFVVSVDFDYGGADDERPDPFSDCRAGFEIRTRRRCRAITISTHVDEASPTMRYDFTYVDELVAGGARGPEELPANCASLLGRVRATGLAAPGRGDDQPMPALDFSYTAFQPATRRFRRLSGRDMPPVTLADPQLELVDLSGDGLPDFLETKGAYRYWSNLGEGRFDQPRVVSRAPAGVRLGTPGVSLVDADGDGRAELVVNQPDFAASYSLRQDGTYAHDTVRQFDAFPSFDASDADVRYIDLSGDGTTDAVRSGHDFECFFADRDGGWDRLVRRPRGVAGSFPDVSFADPRVRIADMNGDGLSDIVLIHDRNVEYWPNHGNGRWGQRITMRDAPFLPRGYQPQQVLLGDIDGDGLSDLVFIDDCRVLAFINQGGNRWSAPVEVDGTPRLRGDSDVRLVDLDGVGSAGILWSDAGGAGGLARFWFLDLTSATKPYLLAAMDNNMGARTEVTYRTSSEDYVADRSHRDTRWRTTLPTPVQVVGRVAVHDHFSGNSLIREYRYRHGLYDGDERSYVGFGRVDVREAEFAAQVDGAHDPFAGFAAQLRGPPTERRTWFDLGPVGPGYGDWDLLDLSHEYWQGDPPGFPEMRAEIADVVRGLNRRRHRRDGLRALRGSVLREELYALDGRPESDRPYTARETLRGLRPERVPESAAEVPVFFAFEVATRTTQWDRGEDPRTTIKVIGNYDAYGKAARSVAVGCPRGWQGFREPRDDFFAVMKVKRFAERDDETHYMVDREAEAEELAIAGVPGGGAVTVEALTRAALEDNADTSRLGLMRNHYDGPAFEGLPLGQLGPFGALVRSELLAFTSAQIAEALAGMPDTDLGSGLPPYLDPTEPDDWPSAYPQRMRSVTGQSAGYRLEANGTGTDYFAQTQRQAFDFHDAAPGEPVVGLVRRTRDPRGFDTAITHDDALLFVARTEGPTGIVSTVAHDYHAMQPALVTHPNGNRTAYAFTPAGKLESIAVMGPEGTDIGDTQDEPSKRYEYDYLAFEVSPPDARAPVSVTTIQRQYHVNGPFAAPESHDVVSRNREFSDGFGRLLQTRGNAEEIVHGGDPFGEENGLPADQSLASGPAVPSTVADRVRVTGAITYDSQGRAVETFEPYFDTGLDYRPPAQEQSGRRTELFYDAAGREVRRRLPDGAEQWTVPGVPPDLSIPSEFAPTPWESYAYDANDLAPLSRAPDMSELTEGAPATHHFTPSSIEIDAMGEIVRSVDRTGPDPTDELTTLNRYDLRGNLIEVADPLGRPAFRYQYDHRNEVLRTESIDTGVSVTLADAAGDAVEWRDSKGALVLTARDALGRPVGIWARDREALAVTRREVMVYGDTAPESLITRDAARAANLLGQLFQQYDGAGRITFTSYNFKGDNLEAIREAFSDATLETALDSGADDFQPDWTGEPGEGLEDAALSLLDPQQFATQTEYDALNRPIHRVLPQDVEGERREIALHYGPAGPLASMTLNGETVVEHIAYDAKGQRMLAVYGNGVMTRYAYHHGSLRIARLRSERFVEDAALQFAPQGEPLQDFAYSHDLVGNLVAITDRTPESGIPNSLPPDDPDLAPLVASGNALVRRFEYDALYRLVSATGREHDVALDAVPWSDPARTTDFAQTRAYTELYRHDLLGNLEEIRHLAGSQGTFTKSFEMVEAPAGGPASNRLARMTVQGVDFDYAHDEAGNAIEETTSRFFAWNASNQLKGFRVQAGGGPASVAAIYLYGADGARVKKLVRRQGGQILSVTVVAGLEHTREGGVANDMIDLSDGEARIASFRMGPAFDDDTTPAEKFYLTDHLGSINLVLDAAGSFIDREETLPYGQTSFGSFARKQWRFTGQRRDEESGLQLHGARYYAPWLARWLSGDPIGAAGGLSQYRYAAGNPLGATDPSGTYPRYTGDPDNLAERTAFLDKVYEQSEQTQYVRDDFERALDLISSTITDPYANTIAKHYGGDTAWYESETFELSTDTGGDYGVTNSGCTKFNLTAIYERLKAENLLDDEVARATFIASTLVHEFSHITHQKTSSDFRRLSMEAYAYGIEYWFLRQAGSGLEVKEGERSFLEQHILDYFTSGSGSGVPAYKVTFITSLLIMSDLSDQVYVSQGLEDLGKTPDVTSKQAWHLYHEYLYIGKRASARDDLTKFINAAEVKVSDMSKDALSDRFNLDYTFKTQFPDELKPGEFIQ